MDVIPDPEKCHYGYKPDPEKDHHACLNYWAKGCCETGYPHVLKVPIS